MDNSSQTSFAGRFLCTRQIARFVLFSGLAAAVNIGSGYLFYAVVGFKEGWRYGASVALAYLLGMGVSFGLNRRFTFASSGRGINDEMRTFFLVSVGGLLLTVTLSSLFRALLHSWLLRMPALVDSMPADVNLEMFGHVVAVGLVAFYSFAAHKLFSFGPGIRYFLMPRWNGRGT